MLYGTVCLDEKLTFCVELLFIAFPFNFYLDLLEYLWLTFTDSNTNSVLDSKQIQKVDKIEREQTQG